MRDYWTLLIRTNRNTVSRSSSPSLVGRLFLIRYGTWYCSYYYSFVYLLILFYSILFYSILFCRNHCDCCGSISKQTGIVGLSIYYSPQYPYLCISYLHLFSSLIFPSLLSSPLIFPHPYPHLLN